MCSGSSISPIPLASSPDCDVIAIPAIAPHAYGKDRRADLFPRRNIRACRVFAPRPAWERAFEAVPGARPAAARAGAPLEAAVRGALPGGPADAVVAPADGLPRAAAPDAGPPPGAAVRPGGGVRPGAM